MADGDTTAGGFLRKPVEGDEGIGALVVGTDPDSPLSVETELPTPAALGDADANSDVPTVGSRPQLWVGGSWRRLPGMGAGDGTAGVTGLASVSEGMVFNGSTWDRARSIGSSGIAATGVPAAGQALLHSDGFFRAARPAAALSDGDSGQTTGAVAPLLFNGATNDKQRGNTQGTLLASAARTAAATSAAQTNYNARGVVLILSVTAASGTGGLQVRFDFLDPISGNALGITALPTAVTATGTYSYVIYPGASSGGTQNTSNVCPRSWQARVAVGDASSYTYSLAYAYVL